MKGDTKKTMTCEWIKVDPVEGEVCPATNEEEFLDNESLVKCFIFKANLLL